MEGVVLFDGGVGIAYVYMLVVALSKLSVAGFMSYLNGKVLLWHLTDIRKLEQSIVIDILGEGLLLIMYKVVYANIKRYEEQTNEDEVRLQTSSSFVCCTIFLMLLGIIFSKLS